MCQVATRAGFVLHHHTLADVLAQFLGDDARGDVGGAAGGEPDHHGHGLLGREDLGLCGPHGQGKRAARALPAISLRCCIVLSPLHAGRCQRFQGAIVCSGCYSVNCNF
jgi:hypothetical protein